jgi:hypothetical protein
MKNDLHVESMTPTEAIELTKKLRRDANDYLAHGQSPENKTIGRAYRQASDAIENMIEANLKDTENEHLLANFRDGRKQLAKIESVRRALTGNDQVDARKLYAQHKAKVPLTDELKTVAKFAGRWPKAAQTTEKMGSVTKVSPLDVATGLLGGIKTASAALVGRPVVRGGALTQFGQNQFVKALDKTSPFGISDDSLVRQLGELSNPIAGTAQQQRQQ